MWSKWNKTRKILWSYYAITMFFHTWAGMRDGISGGPAGTELDFYFTYVYWFVFIFIAIHIVDAIVAVCRGTKKVVNSEIVERKKTYNDLPEIGKIRQDIQIKKTFAIGGFIAPIIVFIFFSFIITPLFAILPAFISARWAWRNLGEQSEEILKDQERRQKLCS